MVCLRFVCWYIMEVIAIGINMVKLWAYTFGKEWWHDWWKEIPRQTAKTGNWGVILKETVRWVMKSVNGSRKGILASRGNLSHRGYAWWWLAIATSHVPRLLIWTALLAFNVLCSAFNLCARAAGLLNLYNWILKPLGERNETSYSLLEAFSQEPLL